MHRYRSTMISGSPWQLLRLLSWRGVLGFAVGLAAFVTIALVAGAVLLVMVPIVFVAAMVGRWLVGRKQPVQPTRHAPDLIEGRYEVVEEAEPPPRPGTKWRP